MLRLPLGTHPWATPAETINVELDQNSFDPVWQAGVGGIEIHCHIAGMRQGMHAVADHAPAVGERHQMRRAVQPAEYTSRWFGPP